MGKAQNFLTAPRIWTSYLSASLHALLSSSQPIGVALFSKCQRILDLVQITQQCVYTLDDSNITWVNYRLYRTVWRSLMNSSLVLTDSNYNYRFTRYISIMFIRHQQQAEIPLINCFIQLSLARTFYVMQGLWKMTSGAWTIAAQPAYRNVFLSPHRGQSETAEKGQNWKWDEERLGICGRFLIPFIVCLPTPWAGYGLDVSGRIPDIGGLGDEVSEAEAFCIPVLQTWIFEVKWWLHHCTSSATTPQLDGKI